MRGYPRTAAASLSTVFFFVVPHTATAQAVTTFSNTGAIHIVDAAAAVPSPSTISVSGLTGHVIKLRVTLHNYTHTQGQDVSAWLVGPNAMMLLFARGPSANFTNVTLSLDDCAPRAIYSDGVVAPFASGRYRPGVRQMLSPFDVQVPILGESVLTLSSFNGPASIANNDWHLYVRDLSLGNVGTIANGWSLTFYTQPQLPQPTTSMAPSCAKPDYDGDGRTDVAVYRPNTGEWFILQSSTNTGSVTSWGAPSSTGAGDIAVPGDYDGDGQTDMAVYRESTGTWYLRYSFGGAASIGFGAPAFLGLGDRPVPGDYDGDGLHDLAVYREATGVWYILKSNGTGLATYTWGAPGDYPARR